MADGPILRWALALPVLCYGYILWYGLRDSRSAGTSGPGPAVQPIAAASFF